MLVKVFGSAVFGVEATTITVEENIDKGIGYHLVGLPDSAIKESSYRIAAALKNNNYSLPGKKITINRVFSPPNDKNLILQVNDDHVKKEKKLKKDDAFLNYLRRIIILLKTKRFENSYQNLLKDSFFREKLIK